MRAADTVIVLLIAVDSPVPTGEFSGWSVVYYSAGNDSNRVFIMGGGIIAGKELFGGPACRTTQRDVWVRAWLSRNSYPWDPSRAVWAFSHN